MSKMNNVILFVVVIVTGWSMSAACSPLAYTNDPGKWRTAQTSTNYSSNVTNGIPHNVCEKITVPYCQGIGYNYTKLPNIFGHRDQAEASRIHLFWPLIEIGCSSSLQTFLCSVYVPMCIGAGVTAPPCRSLCEESRKGCEPLMNKYGFVWSKKLDCLSFPVQESGQACINITTTSRPTAIVPPEKYTLLTKVQANFTSPNYPNPYPRRIKCNWIIQLPDSYKVVKITIKEMLLEEDRYCRFDYIIIKDKMHNQVGPRHCGTYRYPYVVPVRGNKAIITFVSDGGTMKAGFVIKYKGLLSSDNKLKPQTRKIWIFVVFYILNSFL